MGIIYGYSVLICGGVIDRGLPCTSWYSVLSIYYCTVTAHLHLSIDTTPLVGGGEGMREEGKEGGDEGIGHLTWPNRPRNS